MSNSYKIFEWDKKQIYSTPGGFGGLKPRSNNCHITSLCSLFMRRDTSGVSKMYAELGFKKYEVDGLTIYSNTKGIDKFI